MAKAYDADISTEQELLRGSLAKERRRNTLETLRNVLASTVNPAIGLIGRRGGEMTTLQKEAQRAAIEKAKREELARQQAMEQAIQERAAAQQRQALAAMTSAGGGIASETGAAARSRATLQTRVLANQRDREEAKERRELARELGQIPADMRQTTYGYDGGTGGTGGGGSIAQATNTGDGLSPDALKTVDAALKKGGTTLTMDESSTPSFDLSTKSSAGTSRRPNRTTQTQTTLPDADPNIIPDLGELRQYVMNTPQIPLDAATVPSTEAEIQATEQRLANIEAVSPENLDAVGATNLQEMRNDVQRLRTEFDAKQAIEDEMKDLAEKKAAQQTSGDTSTLREVTDSARAMADRSRQVAEMSPEERFASSLQEVQGDPRAQFDRQIEFLEQYPERRSAIELKSRLMSTPGFQDFMKKYELEGQPDLAWRKWNRTYKFQKRAKARNRRRREALRRKEGLDQG